MAGHSYWAFCGFGHKAKHDTLATSKTQRILKAKKNVKKSHVIIVGMANCKNLYARKKKTTPLLVEGPALSLGGKPQPFFLRKNILKFHCGCFYIQVQLLFC